MRLKKLTVLQKKADFGVCKSGGGHWSKTKVSEQLLQQEGSDTVNIWQAKLVLCLERDLKLHWVFSGHCTAIFLCENWKSLGTERTDGKERSQQTTSSLSEGHNRLRRELFIIPLRVLSSFANFLHEWKWEVAQSITAIQQAARYNWPDVKQTWGKGNSSLRGSF